jgi:hypothetical protein
MVKNQLPRDVGLKSEVYSNTSFGLSKGRRTHATQFSNQANLITHASAPRPHTQGVHRAVADWRIEEIPHFLLHQSHGGNAR